MMTRRTKKVSQGWMREGVDAFFVCFVSSLIGNDESVQRTSVYGNVDVMGEEKEKEPKDVQERESLEARARVTAAAAAVRQTRCQNSDLPRSSPLYCNDILYCYYCVRREGRIDWMCFAQHPVSKLRRILGLKLLSLNLSSANVIGTCVEAQRLHGGSSSGEG